MSCLGLSAFLSYTYIYMMSFSIIIQHVLECIRDKVVETLAISTTKDGLKEFEDCNMDRDSAKLILHKLLGFVSEEMNSVGNF